MDWSTDPEQARLLEVLGSNPSRSKRVGIVKPIEGDCEYDQENLTFVFRNEFDRSWPRRKRKKKLVFKRSTIVKWGIWK